MTIDKAYINQIACITFLSSVAFKICMLPKYMSTVGGPDIWLSITLMMLVETVMFGVVYYTIYNQNALFMTDNKWLVAPIMICLYITSMIKELVFFNEFGSYTVSMLFDNGKYTFVIVILLPVIAYIVYKGGKAIARLSQILTYIVVGMLLLIIFLFAIDMDWSNFLPMLTDGGKGAFKAVDLHYAWFGDYLPLFFFTMVRKEGSRHQKYTLPVMLAFIFVAVVGFYLIFIGIYGEAGFMVNFAFNRTGEYNRLSAVLWPNNMIEILMWSLMALMKLVYILFTAVYALMYFIKKLWLSIAVNCVIIGVVIWFFLPNVNESYSFGISFIRYLCAITHYLVPVILAVFKWRQNGKTLQV